MRLRKTVVYEMPLEDSDPLLELIEPDTTTQRLPEGLFPLALLDVDARYVRSETYEVIADDQAPKQIVPVSLGENDAPDHRVIVITDGQQDEIEAEADVIEALQKRRDAVRALGVARQNRDAADDACQAAASALQHARESFDRVVSDYIELEADDDSVR
jgi:hypothetical protein